MLTTGKYLLGLQELRKKNVFPVNNVSRLSPENQQQQQQQQHVIRSGSP